MANVCQPLCSALFLLNFSFKTTCKCCSCLMALQQLDAHPPCINVDIHNCIVSKIQNFNRYDENYLYQNDDVLFNINTYFFSLKLNFNLNSTNNSKLLYIKNISLQFMTYIYFLFNFTFYVYNVLLFHFNFFVHMSLYTYIYILTNM